MLHKRRMLKMVAGVAAGFAVSFGTGCHEHKDKEDHGPLTATGIQVERMNKQRKDPREHWKQMSDNAMLSDMSVVDYHFVPHTSELSGTGADRLSHMAVYLDTYGGTVRYDTLLRDEELVQKRIDHVREYLEVSGADLSNVEITAMMSGGQMMTAREAIKIDEKGTAKPQSGSGQSVFLSGPSPNP